MVWVDLVRFSPVSFLKGLKGFHIKPNKFSFGQKIKLEEGKKAESKSKKDLYTILLLAEPQR